MPRSEWLALVAAHSDAWLMGVAFFYAVKLDASGRARLHARLNALPTLFEVASGRAPPAPRPARKAGAPGAGPLPPRLPPVPFTELPASANGSKLPDPRGRVLTYDDITPRLQGKFTEVRPGGGGGRARRRGARRRGGAGGRRVKGPSLRPPRPPPPPAAARCTGRTTRCGTSCTSTASTCAPRRPSAARRPGAGAGGGGSAGCVVRRPRAARGSHSAGVAAGSAPPPAPAAPPSIIYYPSEELEELDLDEIARDGHMSLLPQAGLA